MYRRMKLCLTAGYLIGGLLAGGALQAAADSGSFFPFVIPWDDATSKTPTDVSFLNRTVEPVVSRDGHFYGKTSGKRIRFVAVSFAAKANFPTHADAEKVAARMAKYGINLVRMHHMDNEWGPDDSIWDWSFPDHQHINPDHRDRMDYLVAQLEKHGIYVDINLHVSRQFTQADGFPASVEDIPFGYDKRVDQFDTRMIELQKDYARDLLTHVNPYTHKAYIDDPGVAMVEINNENSLEGDPWSTIGGGLDHLPAPFDAELTGLWNNWLHKTYGTDDAMGEAWTKGVTPQGPSIVGPDSKWSMEVQGGGVATISPAIEDEPGARPNAAPPAIADITAVDGTNWHIQATISDLTLVNGDTYTIHFRARADAPRTVNVNLQLGKPDWTILGLDANPQITTDWQNFQYSFVAHDAEPSMAKLDFVVGNASGKVWISGLTLSSGLPNNGLPVGESLAQSTISIPSTGGAAGGEWHDWVRFLGDTEKNYADGMRTYLKSTLGVKTNVIESQLGFGGMTSVRREMDMDYLDSHAYWQHPNFPHKPWDAGDWDIPNTSMVSELAKGGGGTLRELAEYRVAGKPYTVSEYNHPAPSDFQAETVPIIFSYAAAQDWDAVFLFDYGDYGTGVDNDKIDGYFGIAANPSKFAFLPDAAMLFRASLLDPLPGLVTSTIPVAGDNRDAYLVTSDLWKQPAPFLNDRIAIVPTTAPGAEPEVSVKPGKPTPGSTRVSIEKLSDDPVYVAAGARAQAITGFVGGHTLTVGPATYQVDSFGNDYAAIMLAPIDTLPLAKSRHLLLTVVGKVENQGMVWNTDRTSVGANWGHAPVQAEAVPGSVTLDIDGPRTVRALTSTGTVKAVVPSKYQNGKLTFRIGNDQTLWYSITAD